MRELMKIILIAVSFFITLAIIVVTKDPNKSGIGGPLGIILLFGFMAGARAIWKYNPDKAKSNKTDDKHKLDKR